MKKLNLIYYNNGVGLTKDALILDSILNKQFVINHVDINCGKCSESDINLFIQNIDENNIEYLFTANTNILIPNIEWMSSFCIENLHRFDLILSKSNECRTHLLKHNNKIQFCGFTSIDRFDPTISKQNTFFHLCGKSIQKNTELIVDVFNENGLPITIVDYTGRFLGKTKNNINYINRFLSEPELNPLFNSHLYHICPSINEGWGHYIYEALSCESIVFTSNANPMNEFLTNDCCVMINCHNNVDYPNSLYAIESHHFPFRTPNYVLKNELKVKLESAHKYNHVSKNARTKYIELNGSFTNKIVELLKPYSEA